MKLNNSFKKWLTSKDCYGNRMVRNWERSAIEESLKNLDESIIVEGDIDKDPPNKILVDITYLSKDDFQPGKKIIINLAHFIRPCPCDCHKWQYECYLNDCACCTDECT